MGLNGKEAMAGVFHYAVGVGKKATGIDAYQRWQKYDSGIPNIVGAIGTRKLIGGIVGLVQVASPFYVDSVSRLNQLGSESRVTPARIAQAVPEMATEALTWGLVLGPSVLEHPLETAAIKAGINIGGPIVADIYYKATDLLGPPVGRFIRNVINTRPSPAVLSV